MTKKDSFNLADQKLELVGALLDHSIQAHVKIPPEMGKIGLLQADFVHRSVWYEAPQRQCKKGVDLTRITSQSANPMLDNKNYTTCFDMSEFNVTGDTAIYNVFYFDWCRNKTGAENCAS